VVEEEGRGVIRRIAVWFHPGHVLQWELVRTPNQDRSRIPLLFLDYGEAPVAMDQVYPQGRPEHLREGQIIVVALDYDPAGESDSLVPSTVTRWYRRDSKGFRAVSEMDANAPQGGRGAERGAKP
jgi:hypothetical protein